MIRGKLAAQPRTAFGKRACRHLRADGLVPGNMYGHKEAPESVAASAKDVLSLAKAGVRVVDVTVGGKTTITVIKEVGPDGQDRLAISDWGNDPTAKPSPSGSPSPSPAKK